MIRNCATGEMYLPMEHPALGSHKVQNAPFKLSETPAFNHLPSPLIGQHTREIVEGLLGYSHEELRAGFADGTFWPTKRPRFPYMEEMLAMIDAPGPLAGLRVLELADEKGQFCGKLLGDLGADVVKIEPPGGERSRHVGPFLDDIPHPERSLSFWYYNTSKRGITLDLETADGRELFGRLAADADVILETFRPGFLASLGLGYETLRRTKPGADHVFADRRSARPAHGGTTSPATCCTWRRAGRWHRAATMRRMCRMLRRSRPVAAMRGTWAVITPTWRSWLRWSTGRSRGRGSTSMHRSTKRVR